MKINFTYPTTIWESILTQIYVFLVLFTIFDFYHEKYIKKMEKKILPQICYDWKQHFKQNYSFQLCYMRYTD